MNAPHIAADQYEGLTSRGPSIASFIAALTAENWNGLIRTERAARMVLSTDNSIYQRVPRAVLEPRDMTAMAVATTQAAQHGVAITARGGSTGTNGQSLADAIVMDCSRYRNRIVVIDAENGLAVVEPGVVLDQLNAAARPLGWIFGPSVSTANRATLVRTTLTKRPGRRAFSETSRNCFATHCPAIQRNSPGCSRR